MPQTSRSNYLQLGARVRVGYSRRTPGPGDVYAISSARGMSRRLAVRGRRTLPVLFAGPVYHAHQQKRWPATLRSQWSQHRSMPSTFFERPLMNLGRLGGAMVAVAPFLLLRCGDGDESPGPVRADASGDSFDSGGGGSSGSSGFGGNGATVGFGGSGGSPTDGSCIQDGVVNLDCGSPPPPDKLKCTDPAGCPPGRSVVSSSSAVTILRRSPSIAARSSVARNFAQAR
jgi:hypothetical protein